MTALEVGSIFDRRYQVVRKLGEGGYGVVYEAQRTHGPGTVALKLLHGQFEPHSVQRKRFVREAELVQRLQHPNIVRLLDVGVAEDGIPFMAFEHLRGHTLEDLLVASGALPIAQVISIMKSLLETLAFAHGQGVVHRDIKPANVFLSEEGTGTVLKVLDFGVAKAVAGDEQRTKLTAAGAAIGTPYYMAPEQIRSSANIDGRADLYAVGMMLGEFLTGTPLVKGTSKMEVLTAHLSGVEHEVAAAIATSPLGPVVIRAIRKDPANRYGDASEMASAVVAAAASIAQAPTAYVPVYPPSAAPLTAPSTGESFTGSTGGAASGHDYRDSVPSAAPPTNESHAPAARVSHAVTPPGVLYAPEGQPTLGQTAPAQMHQWGPQRGSWNTPHQASGQLAQHHPSHVPSAHYSDRTQGSKTGLIVGLIVAGTLILGLVAVGLLAVMRRGDAPTTKRVTTTPTPTAEIPRGKAPFRPEVDALDVVRLAAIYRKRGSLANATIMPRSDDDLKMAVLMVPERGQLSIYSEATPIHLKHVADGFIDGIAQSPGRQYVCQGRYTVVYIYAIHGTPQRFLTEALELLK